MDAQSLEDELDSLHQNQNSLSEELDDDDNNNNNNNNSKFISFVPIMSGKKQHIILIRLKKIVLGNIDLHPLSRPMEMLNQLHILYQTLFKSKPSKSLKSKRIVDKPNDPESGLFFFFFFESSKKKLFCFLINQRFFKYFYSFQNHFHFIC